MDVGAAAVLDNEGTEPTPVQSEGVEASGTQREGLPNKGLDAEGVEVKSVIRCGGMAMAGNVKEMEGGSENGKIDLLGDTSFLMSEEGVVYQCFPLSEQEVIIVSLEEGDLVVGEQVSAPPLPSSSSPSSCVSPSVPSLPPVMHSSTQTEPKVTATGGGRPVCGVHEADAAHTHGSTKPDSLTTKRRRKHSAKDTQPPTQEPHKEVTASTPANHSIKGREQVASDWLHCFMCPERLPSSATLRHHYATAHNQPHINPTKVSCIYTYKVLIQNIMKAIKSKARKDKHNSIHML